MSICLGLADNTLLILHFSSDDTQPHSVLLIIISGVFRFIKDNFINSPSADLTPELMDMLMAVMLVCYQHVNSPCLLLCILFTPFLTIQLLMRRILLAKATGIKKPWLPACPLGKQLSHFACVQDRSLLFLIKQGANWDWQNLFSLYQCFVVIFHILYYHWGRENHSLLWRSLLCRGNMQAKLFWIARG